MTRKIAGIASLATVVATLGFATTAVPGAAHADPAISTPPAAQGEPQTSKPDNRPDPMSRHQAGVRQKAVDDLVAGKAKLVGKGPDRTIQMANGDQVEYPASQSAQLLTFLVQFGDDAAGASYPDNTAGPLHNTIAEPDASDNTTYYLPDFNRQHYLDMFFNGLADQGGESFRDVYKEESSGRFDLQGDVSDWVTVPNAASYYQSGDGKGDEDGTSMYNFLTDGADAWYQAQLGAGKTPAEIKTYLQQFDVWDRFDHDDDGNYNESDGYIDHFQAIHAGEDESAGAPKWAMWAHRSATNINADVGPDGNHNGGVQIGSTGLWIRDYTVEPENGGIGVFAHEFGHDLGLDDYYETSGGDNSTGFWTLMSQGSWNSHGVDNIGTTPNHVGAPDKLFLGWYGADDLAIIGGTAAPQTLNLGPSYHATAQGAQALAVHLPQGQATTEVVDPDQGTHYFYSGTGDNRDATLTSPDVTVPNGDPTLDARVSYDLEEDYDYTYLQVSADGGTTWDNVETSLSTTDDPNQANAGFGITNCSGTGTGAVDCDPAWTDLTADLTAYAGDSVMLRFETVNDPGTHGLGFSVDSISLGGTLVTDVEDGAEDWTLDGYRVMDGSSFTQIFDQYYMAENKQRFGYEKTLFQGPYSFDYATSAPNKVDHYPYQDGLLVWYVSGRYTDNDVSVHPGGGEALVVDSNPTYTYWKKNGVNTSFASGNLNSYDSTFDVDQADGLHLTRESATGGTDFNVPAHASVPVFEDSNVDAYVDPTIPAPRTGWYSTKVAGIGTEIQVLSSDETTGQMVVKVGRKFVAATSDAAITGSTAVGSTLTAVAPHYFQSGVAAAFQWKVNGAPVAGATGSTYQVKAADLGKQITVTVTGTKADYLSSTTTAPAVTAGVAATTLSVDAPKKVKKGQQITLTVSVSAVGATPTGKVTVSLGKKEVTGQLVNGKVTLSLGKARKTGKQTVTVTYVPDSGFAAASTTVVVKVIKKKH